jgi:hypothetical protein
MNDSWTRLTAMTLAGVGIAAELNMFRVACGWIREARRDRAGRRKRRRAPEADKATGKGDAHSIGVLLALCGLSFAASPTLAQAPADQPAGVPAPLTISSDRPSFGDGTGIAPLGHLQVETGYTFTHRDRDGAETDRHNGPEGLIRVGLIEDRLEVRAVWSGLVSAHTESGGATSIASGFSDLVLGFKLKLVDQAQLAAWAPRIALEVQTTLGAGSSDVSTQKVEPVVKFLWSYDLGALYGRAWNGWSIGGNLNVAWPTAGGDHFSQFQGSFCVTAPLFNKCSGFAEYYVLGPNSKDSDAAHYVDVGVTYLLQDRVQLDARVGFGLNNEADNFFAGVGISFLF